jgi:hypothetical protein
MITRYQVKLVPLLTAQQLEQENIYLAWKSGDERKTRHKTNRAGGAGQRQRTSGSDGTNNVHD